MESQLTGKLNWIIGLLTANFLLMILLAGALLLGLLPKVERAVQTTERMEARFQSFANEVEPVVVAGAGKAVQAIQQIDAEKLSEKATEGSSLLIDSATQRAKRFLERDQSKNE